MRPAALFVTVTETPHGDADEIELFAEIGAAAAHHQVQLEADPLPQAKASFPGFRQESADFLARQHLCILFCRVAKPPGFEAPAQA